MRFGSSWFHGFTISLEDEATGIILSISSVVVIAVVVVVVVAAAVVVVGKTRILQNHLFLRKCLPA